MLHLDVRTPDTKDRDVRVKYIMREICGPNDEASYLQFDVSYASGYTVEELIAACAADGSIVFFRKHHKRSERVSLIIEEDN